MQAEKVIIFFPDREDDPHLAMDLCLRFQKLASVTQ